MRASDSSRASGNTGFVLSGDSLGHLGAALRKQWKRYRKELKRCQDKFSAKAIHNSRVETRRLLAVVELLGNFLPAGLVKKIERALKRHLDTFDDLRDTQVQLQLVGKMRHRFPAARKFHGYLLKREDRFARRTRKRIKKVKASRLARLIREFLEGVAEQQDTRTPQQANGILWRTAGRAFARANQLRARIDPRDTETIHRTRVAFKKFRYMVEALADCLPFADQKRLKAMRNYQALMGNIQDAEVLLATLDKYFGKQKLEPETGLRFREELLGRRELLTRRYLDAAGQLLQFWPAPERPSSSPRPSTLDP